MVREILVDWTTAAGTGKRSVMFFNEVTAVADQRAALDDFLTAFCGGLDNTTSYVIETAGRELSTTTGELIGAWAEPTVYTGTGTISGECVPDAAQVLVRWDTGNIVGGRFLRGHTYIPGLSTLNLLNGNLTPTAVDRKSVV